MLKKVHYLTLDEAILLHRQMWNIAANIAENDGTVSKADALLNLGYDPDSIYCQCFLCEYSKDIYNHVVINPDARDKYKRRDASKYHHNRCEFCPINFVDDVDVADTGYVMLAPCTVHESPYSIYHDYVTFGQHKGVSLNSDEGRKQLVDACKQISNLPLA